MPSNDSARNAPRVASPRKKATGQKVSRARGSATNHKKNPGKRAHKGGS